MKRKDIQPGRLMAWQRSKFVSPAPVVVLSAEVWQTVRSPERAYTRARPGMTPKRSYNHESGYPAVRLSTSHVHHQQVTPAALEALRGITMERFTMARTPSFHVIAEGETVWLQFFLTTLIQVIDDWETVTTRQEISERDHVLRAQERREAEGRARELRVRMAARFRALGISPQFGLADHGPVPLGVSLRAIDADWVLEVLESEGSTFMGENLLQHHLRFVREHGGNPESPEDLHRFGVQERGEVS